VKHSCIWKKVYLHSEREREFEYWSHCRM